MTSEDLIYQEKLSSNRTEALFLALAVLFLLLFAWRFQTSCAGVLSAIFLFFFVLFLFYSINYRTLIIDLTPERLKLKFGIFSWTVPLENIESCHLDDVSLVRIGGAGIHFTFIRGRYRVMFNFLEYPRLVLRLKQKRGQVKDVVFSTRRPVEIEQLIKQGISYKEQ
jgi:Ca2+/Na+ antiporter